MSETLIPTADGETLQAELHLVDGARAAIVIAHPNPKMGGDMHAPVPAVLYRAAEAIGVSALRFNFRGVGSSTGTHDEGVAEQLDMAAAFDHLGDAAGDVPLLAGGWSFGADVSLSLTDPRVAGWLLAAAPFKVIDAEFMAARLAPGPKVFAVPANDHICSPELATTTVAEWTNAHIVVIDDTDHFFGGRLNDLVSLLGQLVDDVTAETA